MAFQIGLKYAVLLEIISDVCKYEGPVALEECVGVRGFVSLETMNAKEPCYQTGWEP